MRSLSLLKLLLAEEHVSKIWYSSDERAHVDHVDSETWIAPQQWEDIT